MNGSKGQKRGQSLRLTVMVLAAVVVTVLLAMFVVETYFADEQDVSTEQDFVYDGIKYYVLSETDHTVLLSRCHVPRENIVIPEKVLFEGIQYTVVQIGPESFQQLPLIRTVTMPDTVRSIEFNAFRDCVGLDRIVLSSNLEYIGEGAFSECKGLRHIDLNDGLTRIGVSAFLWCSSMTSFSIPASVTYIGESAFKSCASLRTIDVDVDNKYYASFDGCLYDKGLTSLIACPMGYSGHLNIPEGVTSVMSEASYSGSIASVSFPSTLESIGAFAFFRCNGLKDVFLPANVTTISGYAFRECSALAAIDVHVDNPSFVSYDGLLYERSPLVLVICPNGKGGSITVHDGTCKVRPYAFYMNERVTSVTLPDSILEIGFCAFSQTPKLMAMELPDSLETMDSYAFDQSGIEHVNYPSNLTRFGDSIFARCPALRSVTIPEGVTELPENVFMGCVSLSDIELPSTLVSLGDMAFTDCRSLISISIPDGLKVIKYCTFLSCHALRSVDFGNGVMVIEESAFEDCESLDSIILPDSVIRIGTYSFYECLNVTSVHLGSGLIEIGPCAFMYCDSVLNYTVADGNTMFRSVNGVLYSEDMFELLNYPSGRSGAFTVPEGVSALTNYSFFNCIGMTAINFSSTVSIVDVYTFFGCSGITAFNIPSSSEYFSSLDGVLFNKDKQVLIAYPAGKEGPYTDMPSSVQYIEELAFFKCLHLTAIVMGENVHTITDNAFDGCTALTRVVLSPNLRSISPYAFNNCPLLETVHLPASLTSIGDFAFLHTGITAFTVDKGSDTFKAVDGVLFSKDGTELVLYPEMKAGAYTIPSTTKVVSTAAFVNCRELTSLRITSDLTIDLLFSECHKLTEIIIDEGVTDVASYDGVVYSDDLGALILCPVGRTTVTLPTNVLMFESYSFLECSNLREIIVTGGDKVVIESDAFNESACNFVFKSGRDGYELRTYLDYNRTIPFVIDALFMSEDINLYFEWVEIPDPEVPQGQDVADVLWPIVITIVALGVAALILAMRRLH